jgi:lipopolysaccharide/colanic/teichoic acid biosynthesis glycosyltransferase
MYQPAASPIGKALLSSAEFALPPISYARPSYWPISGWRAVVKRAIDIVGALVLLIPLALPMLVAAAVICLESPGGALFRQRRIGFGNLPFEMWKFRTMRDHAAEPGRLAQATRYDTRVTRFGQLLRRSSFDELPQLFNVLHGDMSLVGPRPHAPGCYAGATPFELVTPHYPARHRVKPGMTGLAQIRGWRGETDTKDKLLRRVECDLEYIDNWSLRMDIAILARSVVPVFAMQNAY